MVVDDVQSALPRQSRIIASPEQLPSPQPLPHATVSDAPGTHVRIESTRQPQSRSVPDIDEAHARVAPMLEKGASPR